MINRYANLYSNYRKKGTSQEIVFVLHIGTVADDHGSCIAASVEKADGEIIEVAHDRLKFINIQRRLHAI